MNQIFKTPSVVWLLFKFTGEFFFLHLLEIHLFHHETHIFKI